jgi:NADPH:quinone reductase-like Zn-dependent oxidoreductase
MKALVVTEHGPPDVLSVQERADPEPGAGEVRIRVRAAGVNFADLLARVGLYPDAPKPPSVVGFEVAGDVDALGEGVDALEVGQRVMAPCRFGGYAQLAVAKAETVLPLPDGWSYSEGASMPVTYATAYAGLVRFGGLRAGERVLIQAAGGGVGIAATQLARLRRATIIGAASAAKHEALRALGVDHPIDPRASDVYREVRRITGERGADVVLDPLGGRSFQTSYRLLAPLGRLVVYGVSAVAPGQRRQWWHAARAIMQMPSFKPLSLMNRNRGVFGLNLAHLWEERQQLASAMRLLLEDLQRGQLRPVVARTFPLERAADAHRYLQSRASIGKVLLTC